MSKVNKMATHDERTQLSKKLKKLKEKFGLTYAEMTRRLGNPCKASTLQSRIYRPSSTCSSRLYKKILEGMVNLDLQRTKKEQFEQLKKEFISEITELTNNYFKKIESLNVDK